MIIDIPFEIGDRIITQSGGVKTVSSMHIYVDQDGDVSNVRVYTDSDTKYITVMKKRKG